MIFWLRLVDIFSEWVLLLLVTVSCNSSLKLFMIPLLRLELLVSIIDWNLYVSMFKVDSSLA